MKKIISAFGLAIAVTLVSNVFVAKALANEHHEFRGGPGMMRVMSMLAELDLTAEQKTQIKTLRQDTKSTMQANKQGHFDFREQMQQLVRSEHFDETAVRALIASKQALRMEMGLMHAKMRNGIWNILTEEQQALMVELKAQRGHRRGRHHGRHHEEGGGGN